MVAVIVVALTTVNDAAAPPIVTESALVKLLPVIVTDVPPTGVPDTGLILVTVGTSPHVSVPVAFIVPSPPRTAMASCEMPPDGTVKGPNVPGLTA